MSNLNKYGFMSLGLVAGLVACESQQGFREGPVNFDSEGAKTVRQRACAQAWTPLRIVPSLLMGWAAMWVFIWCYLWNLMTTLAMWFVLPVAFIAFPWRVFVFHNVYL